MRHPFRVSHRAGVMSESPLPAALPDAEAASLIIFYSKSILTDSVSLYNNELEPRSRIELETSSLPWMRSTTELPGHVSQIINVVQGVGFEPTKA